MIKTNNYYLWLELPLEKIVDDESVLSGTAEKYITEWVSAKGHDINDRANLHGEKIRSVIHDKKAWTTIYDGAVQEFTAFIDNKIKHLRDENNSISKKNFDKLFELAQKEFKITDPGYLKSKLPTGVTVSEGTAGEQTKTASGKKLEDIKPKKYETIKQAQKAIVELGSCNDVFDFIKNYRPKDQNSTASNQDIETVLKAIQKNWRNKQATPEKNAVDHITSGFLKFFKDNDVEEYRKCLNYAAVESILSEMLASLNSFDSHELTDSAYHDITDKINRIIGNPADAQSIVENFCISKKIAYPQLASNKVRCLFCFNSIDKKDIELNKCPCCNHSFIAKCPKCNKEKNLMRDTSCCGVDLQKYPYFEKVLVKANSSIDDVRIRLAESYIKEIKDSWPGFPGVDESVKRLDKIKNDLDSALEKADELIDKGAYFSAKKIIEEKSVHYPKVKELYSNVVYDVCDEAERMFAKYQKTSDPNAKEVIIFEILDMVSDYAEASAEGLKYKVKEVTKISAVVNNEAQGITVQWESLNSAGTTNYYVIRKENAPVSNPSEGRVVTNTQNKSICDTSLEEGKPYYYAVYAKKGPTESPVISTTKPVIFLRKVDVAVDSGDKRINLKWSSSSDCVEAVYSDRKIINPGEGTPVQCTSSGAVIENLQNGVSYSILVYKHMKFGGADFYSPLNCVEGVPFEPVEPPEITKSLGKTDGEYIITPVNASSGRRLELYCCDSGTANVPSNISISELQRKLIKLDCTALPDGRFSVNMKNKTPLSVFPVYFVEKSAIVGKKVDLKYIRAGKITNKRSSANDVHISLDQWPEGANAILIGLSSSSYPSSRVDSDRVIRIVKSDYEKSNSARIPDVGTVKNYLSVFACVGTEQYLIANDVIDNSLPNDIRYKFIVGPFGKVTVSIESKDIIQDNLYFCVSKGTIPIKKEMADKTVVIPPNGSNKMKVTIDGYKAQKGDFARLCSDGKDMLINEGESQLKK